MDKRNAREVIDELWDTAHTWSLPAAPEVLAAVAELGFGHDWDTTLAAVAEARRAVEELERSAVRSARLEGLTWEEIGDALGINRHTARYRFGRGDLAELDELDRAHDAERQAQLAQLRALHARGRDTTGDGALTDEAQQLASRYLALTAEQSAERRELVEQLDADTAPGG